MSNADHSRRLHQLRQLANASTLIGVDMRLGLYKMMDYRDELADVIEILQIKLDKINSKIDLKLEKEFLNQEED